MRNAKSSNIMVGNYSVQWKIIFPALYLRLIMLMDPMHAVCDYSWSMLHDAWWVSSDRQDIQGCY